LTTSPSSTSTSTSFPGKGTITCVGSDGSPRRCCDVADAALADVEAKVIVYGVDCALVVEVGGMVKRISAASDEGKSLRRTRVRERWCGTVLVPASLGERVRDQAFAEECICCCDLRA
jgi:hypothetical protein